MTTSRDGSWTRSQNGLRSLHRLRVDHRQPIARRHLDQAEHRLERLLRDELGVEAEPARGADVADQLLELGGRGDQAFFRPLRTWDVPGKIGSTGQTLIRAPVGSGSRSRLPVRAQAPGDSRPSRNRRIASFAADGFS